MVSYLLIFNIMRFDPGLKLARHSKLGDYFTGKPIAPINIEFSPTGKCNAKCEWCFYRQNSSDLPGLDNEIFKESRMEGLIEEFAGFGVDSISWTGGGEPTLHPSFHKFVEQAHWSGLKQGLFTNGMREPEYDPTYLEWIRVSKTDKKWNEDSLKMLRHCKTLGMCINYTGDDDLIKETIDVAEKINATYIQVRPALVTQGKNVERSIPMIEHPLLHITEYKFFGSNGARQYNSCEAYHFTPFIWQDGSVDVCSYHKGVPRFNLGNVYSEGKKGRFRHIMGNAPPSVPVVIDCQVCCKLNSMNTMIAMMKNLEDIDFP